MWCDVLCICEPPSIPNFQILLLSIVFKIYSHEAAKFNCYPTEDWYLMSWNSLYGSQVFIQIKSDYLCKYLLKQMSSYHISRLSDWN